MRGAFTPSFTREETVRSTSCGPTPLWWSRVPRRHFGPCFSVPRRQAPSRSPQRSRTSGQPVPGARGFAPEVRVVVELLREAAARHRIGRWWSSLARAEPARTLVAIEPPARVPVERVGKFGPWCSGQLRGHLRGQGTVRIPAPISVNCGVRSTSGTSQPPHALWRAPRAPRLPPIRRQHMSVLAGHTQATRSYRSSFAVSSHRSVVWFRAATHGTGTVRLVPTPPGMTGPGRTFQWSPRNVRETADRGGTSKCQKAVGGADRAWTSAARMIAGSVMASASPVPGGTLLSQPAVRRQSWRTDSPPCGAASGSVSQAPYP